MKYRAFWKDTWYECEDYGALCRCLAWVEASSFMCVDWVVPYIHWLTPVNDADVVIYRCEDEN